MVENSLDQWCQERKIRSATKKTLSVFHASMRQEWKFDTVIPTCKHWSFSEPQRMATSSHHMIHMLQSAELWSNSTTCYNDSVRWMQLTGSAHACHNCTQDLVLWTSSASNNDHLKASRQLSHVSTSMCRAWVLFDFPIFFIFVRCV